MILCFKPDYKYKFIKPGPELHKNLRLVLLK